MQHVESFHQPLTIQQDGSIYFRSSHPESKIVHPFLNQFAQLLKSPSDIHIYKLSPFSVWYALEQGVAVKEIITFLTRFSGMDLPEKVTDLLYGWGEKAGILELVNLPEFGPCLLSKDKELLNKIFKGEGRTKVSLHDQEGIVISITERGDIKRRLMGEGYPVLDMLGVEKGENLKFHLKDKIMLRPYQQEAITSFLEVRGGNEGNGFIILPCGSGKTIVGLGIMNEIKEATLIIVPNETSLQQWHTELLDKTTLTAEQTGFYTSEKKEVKPVTITTYQMLTYHNKKTGNFPHFSLFHKKSWGLVIYDEVHLLPAPLFRITSSLQGKRRVGLTATFVREDGKEGDIYSLVGPKRYEVSIKALETNGWIARPVCKEIKVPFTEKQWEAFLTKTKRDRYRFASENEHKLTVVKNLLKRHTREQVIIIGQYIEQLKIISEELNLPLITGETKQKDRKFLYEKFRRGEIKAIVLSRVANMAVDLPGAQVAVQVSGTYGSRQEEAQRIGRLLRPNKTNEPVIFYSLITPMTQEEDAASHRQLFMQEQGYTYEKEEWSPCSSAN